MKVGFIGCGGMGTTHLLSVKALSESKDITVAAVADCRKEYLDKALAIFPDAKGYEYGMDLLDNEELDIVHICLPSYLHADHTVKALEKGIHTLVEKPICLTEEDCDRILEAEAKSGAKAMVGQVVRFFDEYVFLKEAYEKGTYGKLKSLVMRRLSGDTSWGFEDWFHTEERSGSVVLDLHVHDLDFLRYLLGEPQDIQVKASAFESGMVNHIITTYDYPGMFATAEGIWDEAPSTAFPFRASYQAHFEKATIVFDGKADPAVVVYKKDNTVEVPELKPEYEMESDAAGINISQLGPYYTEIKYFYECIENGTEVRTAPLSEGVKSVKLALKELKLAKDYIK